MRIIFLIFFSFIIQCSLFAQLSHGGTPLFPQSMLKSDRNFYIDMPAFDLEEVLKEDELNKSGMRNAFRFAKKFYADIERGKSGINFTLPDGTKVWQVGIRSHGAYSINVLFSEFHIPEGGRLFLYNSDRTHILGSFTHENNSDNNMLPISPIQGDAIIVEYSEPADAIFEGRLKITEVNHAYRNLRKNDEPADDTDKMGCMPDVLCQNPDDPTNNSVVLLVINGTTTCTGTLLNNTAQDGRPYLLTACHCLNDNRSTPTPNYTKNAASIVAFFNYNRPICNTKMRGTEEMSLAGAQPVCIIDSSDVALIRLFDTPPDYFQPYYSGWNINYDKTTQSQNLVPYTNIHHPTGAPKKFGKTNSALKLTDYIPSPYYFYKKSHWQVSGWDIGATAAGSSGSPLFNNRGQVVGGLSGGDSECSKNNPNGRYDYYFALFKGWASNNPADNLKTYLDPVNSGVTDIAGLDIYKDQPLTQLSNANYNAGDALANTTLNSPESGLLFGYNSLQQTTEFAEEYTIDKPAEIVGAYLLAPTVSLGNFPSVKVNLYTGGNAPENLIESVDFYPQYTSYVSQSGSFTESLKTMYKTPTQSFIKFPNEPKIKGKFFIAYEISLSNNVNFSVYNTAFGSAKQNTAWLKDINQGWVKANEYAYQPITTSLALQPLIRYNNETSIDLPGKKLPDKIKYDRTSKMMYIDADAGESGHIEIYTLTGQFIQRFYYSGKSTFAVQPLKEGSIGIVRITSNEDSQTSKIIF